MNDLEELERPHEACGVFGIYAPGQDVARITYFGLFALQHRGQESAGIAVVDGTQLLLHREMGLVSQVFREEEIAALRGHIAIGHTRYSTTGGSVICNAQPIVMEDPQLGPFALAHNGNLANAVALERRLARQGHTLETTSDSEIIAKLLILAPGDTWEARLRHVMPQLSAAYSLVLCTQDSLIAVRDPWAVRPLCIGQIDGNWIIASETCAIDIVGGRVSREVAPGEIIRIDGVGAEHLHSTQGVPERSRASCLFEHIYFARPDSNLGAGSLYSARQRMGRALAREYPVDADVVISVPDSATPAATGYAAARGLPFADGLIKNRYVGRTFISPDQRMRERGVYLKFNALPDVLSGKRVVMIDDSIVRGTTTRQIVQMLRQAGAREVHIGVTSPAFRHPCYLGIDVAQAGELIAAQQSTVEGITATIGADSLHYLSLDSLIEATGLPATHFCTGCFTGKYPVQVQEEEEIVLAGG
ncbi:MAG TPA: amidophosphoribosyltransferase [Ktedonobacterales bacterium]|nr:amidophosphoribosyltransferase [Ktedonobacterales bacterium]